MRSRGFYLHLIFWVGFTALIYEIYSVHVLFLFMVETTQAASLAISAFLAGLGCSSLAFTKLHRDSGREARERILVVMQVLVAVYAATILTRYDWIPLVSDVIDARVESPALSAVIRGVVVWAYLFVPAFFIGGAFPIVNGLYLRSASSATADTGSVYFWDIAGSIAGALIAGFYLIPRLGLRSTIILPVLINLALCALLVRGRTLRLAFVGAIVLASGYAVYTRGTVALANQTYHFEGEEKLKRRFGTVLFQETSPYGRVTVGIDPRRGNRKTLFINYRDMCHSDASESEVLMASEVGALLRPPASVMNIGLGCGFTASEVASHAAVEKLQIVEINPTIAKASREYFRVENRAVLEQQKTTVTLVDGARFLRTRPERFDAILVDIEEITVVYSSPLYTKEYFEIVRQRLKPGGVFALWSFFGSEGMSKVLLNTVRAVFPHVRLRLTERAVMFFASDAPLDGIVPAGADEASQIAQIDRNPIREVNALDRRVLERHYDMRATFGFPAHYYERFVRDPNRWP